MTKRFIDNLFVIMHLIKLEVDEVLTGQKDLIQFYHTFQAESGRKEIKNDLKEAKKVLMLDEDEKDIDIINKKYKELARSHHPDLGGCVEEFKKVNKAHKLIKNEMGI